MISLLKGKFQIDYSDKSIDEKQRLLKISKNNAEFSHSVNVGSVYSRIASVDQDLYKDFTAASDKVYKNYQLLMAENSKSIDIQLEITYLLFAFNICMEIMLENIEGKHSERIEEYELSPGQAVKLSKEINNYLDEQIKQLSEVKTINKPQPFDPNEFPTLVKYDSQQIEDAIQKLMKDRNMTRQQCLVNLELDLSELES